MEKICILIKIIAQEKIRTLNVGSTIIRMVPIKLDTVRSGIL